MASVTDSSLLSAAQDIVTEFLDSKTNLNDGVIKKASELGLNSDQTQRLIERTNTEAFLRVYPNDTEFDVASPEVVLGIKTASINPTIDVPVIEDGLFKAASVQEDYFMRKAASVVPSRYQTKVASVTAEDIFGMDAEFNKVAAATEYERAIDPQNVFFCKEICDTQKTASQLEQENLAREMKFDEAVETLAEHIKQASLQGINSIEEQEAVLLENFPQTSQLTRGIFDAVVTKMASDGVNPNALARYNGVSLKKVANITGKENQLPSSDAWVVKESSSRDLVSKYQKVVNVLLS